MRAHPAAELFPMMDESAYSALREDIRDHGQNQPCITWVDVDDPEAEELLLDGRNRWRACEELGIEPEQERCRLSAKDAIDLVVSLNVHRRHLTASQKAAVSVGLLPMYEAAARGRMLAGAPASLPEGRGEAREHAAAATGASPRYVQEAKALAADDPEAFERVKRGELSLNAARGEKKPPDHYGSALRAVRKLTADEWQRLKDEVDA